MVVKKVKEFLENVHHENNNSLSKHKPICQFIVIFRNKIFTSVMFGYYRYVINELSV